MSENIKDEIMKAHHELGPELYMRAWELIEKKDRTPEETDEMMHVVHGSAYHWSKTKGQVDDDRWKHSFAINHSQITYAYIEIGNAQQALYNAKRCLDYFEKYGEGGYPKA